MNCIQDFMDTASGLSTEHNVIDCEGYSFVSQLLKGKMRSQLLTQVVRVMHIEVNEYTSHRLTNLLPMKLSSLLQA